MSNERFNKNLSILKLIKSSVPLTDYSGFGGLHKVMSPVDYDQLKNIVSEDEFKSIQGSFKTAYYTPTSLINLIYKAVQKLGFQGGRILDPACGHGAFIFNMPESIRANSIIHAIELDTISAKLAKSIYPYAKILNRGFENTAFKAESFDLIVGNPPYSSMKVFDQNFPQYKDLAIHHYFVATSVELLKTGGILAMVLPQYCLDNLRDHPRTIMAKQGSLVAAYRLPDCMFDNAKVTVDIVLYVKNTTLPGVQNRFESLKKITLNQSTLPINEYFLDHPTHVLGNLNTCNLYNERIGLTVALDQGKESVLTRLDSLINGLPALFCTNSDKNVSESILHKISLKITALQGEIHSLKDAFEISLAELEIEKLNRVKSLLESEHAAKAELMKKVSEIDQKIASFTSRFSL